MGFDMIISTLHKNFPGPQQALICTNKVDEHWTKLKSNLSIFVSNMHSYNIYAAGLALNHLEELNIISKEMIKCTKKLVLYLMSKVLLLFSEMTHFMNLQHIIYG